MSIPESLRAEPRWVTWRYEDDPKRPDKPKKMPYQGLPGNPARAKSNDSTTWTGYHNAASAYRTNRHTGVGFMLGDGWAGVDLDGCRNPETGEIAAWAQAWIDQLASYTEVSPSGAGVKIFLQAALPKGITHPLGPHQGYEIYVQGRYFTVTGQHLEGTPETVRAAQAELEALIASLQPAPAPPPEPPATPEPEHAPAPEPTTDWCSTRQRAVETVWKSWVARKVAQAAAYMRSQPSNFHNARVAMGRLLGGVIASAPAGLLSEHDAIAAIYHARLPESHAKQEEQAIRDGIALGRQTPLAAADLPTLPTDAAPVRGACPTCKTKLRRSKFDYPGTVEPGWYCPQCKGAMMWPLGAHGVRANASPRDDTTAPEDGTDPRAPLLPSERIIAALTAAGFAFRLNLLADVIEVNGEPFSDVIKAQVRMQMRDAGVRIGGIEDAWTVAAAANSYHPIRDYLEGTVWDGVERMPQLAAYLRSSDPPVVYADTSSCPLSTVYLTRWLIGAVAKIFGEEQNAMLVLVGGQGIGKSQFVRWLCSGLPNYHAESPINVADKDNHVRLMTRFIWEVSEFDATTRKADIAALKAFISTRTVTVRQSYARYDTVKPAAASLIGTLNDSTGFLTDESGSRRFLVVSLDGMDWAYQDLDINQIWAEAVHRYRSGEPWRLLPEEARHQATQNREYEAESLLTSWIGKYFLIDPARQDWRMTAADIADHLRAKYDIRLSGSERAQAMEISRVMGHLEVARVKSGGQRYYVGIRARADLGLGDGE